MILSLDRGFSPIGSSPTPRHAFVLLGLCHRKLGELLASRRSAAARRHLHRCQPESCRSFSTTRRTLLSFSGIANTRRSQRLGCVASARVHSPKDTVLRISLSRRYDFDKPRRNRVDSVALRLRPILPELKGTTPCRAPRTSPRCPLTRRQRRSTG